MAEINDSLKLYTPDSKEPTIVYPITKGGNVLMNEDGSTTLIDALNSVEQTFINLIQKNGEDIDALQLALNSLKLAFTCNTNTNLFSGCAFSEETVEGVTFTYDSLNEYITVNGTATAKATIVALNVDSISNGQYKVYASSPDSKVTATIYDIDGQTVLGEDTGEGCIVNITNNGCMISLSVAEGTKLENVKFYPMITGYTEATRLDFVHYTGYTGKLNWDLAVLLKRLSSLESNFRNITAGTEDLTAGTSDLATGDIYIVYE